MNTALFGQVRRLVDQACAAYAGTPGEPVTRQISARLAEPLRVAIAGRVKAGKSTLLNALVGQELAATDAGECTQVVTWYRNGPSYRTTLYPIAGAPRQLPFGSNDLAGTPVDAVDRLVVDWPSPLLRTMTLIDTPGLGSTNTAVSARTESALVPEQDGAGTADAVLYLLRHVHGDDVRFLESFHDEPVERRPVNTLAVLSRADEVGHGRPDALTSASRIAARYAADSRVQALCQTVIPVAGLLASSAATLRDIEYRELHALSDLDDEELGRLLLSADRFTNAETDGVPAAARAGLVDRLGMFGVRLALRLIREGAVSTASTLAAELTARSGVGPLRDLLATRFADRAELLKARSALRAIEPVLRTGGRLLPEWERIVAGAHEFAEIQLIDRIRLGSVLFTSTEAQDAQRLLGEAGADISSRLGLPPDADRRLVAEAGQAQLRRWQRRAEHPASPREVRDAARVLVRTCEGILLGARS